MKTEGEKNKGDNFEPYASVKSRQNNFLDSDRKSVPVNMFNSRTPYQIRNPRLIDLTMDDHNLALLNKHKIDKELLRTASLVPSKTMGGGFVQ